MVALPIVLAVTVARPAAAGGRGHKLSPIRSLPASRWRWWPSRPGRSPTSPGGTGRRCAPTTRTAPWPRCRRWRRRKLGPRRRTSITSSRPLRVRRETLTRHYGITSRWAHSGGERLLRRARQLLQLPEHRAFRRVDLAHGLSGRPHGGPRVSGDNWHPLFRHARQRRDAFLRARGYELHKLRVVVDGQPPMPTLPRTGRSARRIRHDLPAADDPAAGLFSLLSATPVTRSSTGTTASASGSPARSRRSRRSASRTARMSSPTCWLCTRALFTPTATAEKDEPRIAERTSEKQGYADQVGYADRIIKDLVATLLADGRQPAAVLIQADEYRSPARRGRCSRSTTRNSGFVGILAAYITTELARSTRTSPSTATA